MKQRILLSMLILVGVCGLAGAVESSWSAFHDVSQTGSTAYREHELIVRFADPAPGTQLQDGPVISGPWARRTIRTMISDSIIAGATVKKEYDAVAPGLVAVRLPEGADVLNAFIEFNRSANVFYAEPNYRYRLFLMPDDPNFPALWGLNNTGQTGGTPGADIDAPEAWDIQTGDSEIIVAVTDTGVDFGHPDLADNMWVNIQEWNGPPDVDDDKNGYVDDIYGYDFAGQLASDPTDGDSNPADSAFHGTHVAGTVGAVGNNGVGVTGVCWNVRIMALKILADDSLVEPAVFASEAVEAIGYAVDNGARVINASWGGDYFSQSLYDAIKDAGDAGVLFVAAAGNDGTDNDIHPVYPASFDLGNIISVMATDHNDQRSAFSNFGARSVDVAEPGTDILSTMPTTATNEMTIQGYDPNYETLSGTSMAAPYVTGACALVWSQYPSLPHEIVKGLLLKTVDHTLTSPWCCQTGGRINLYKALTSIPTGIPGRVLNSKDDPANPDNLYSTIQAAIDDANDGDVLIAESNRIFRET
ncbi:MAG: S8 family peptidase, partial [Planctomycetota bacterium]